MSSSSSFSSYSCALCGTGSNQIDNQLDVTLYPILLYPIPEALPPRHASIVPLPRSTIPVFPSMASGRRRRRARSSSQGPGAEVRRKPRAFSRVRFCFVPSITCSVSRGLRSDGFPSSLTERYLVASVLCSLPTNKACFEVIVRRGIGYPWVNYVRLVSLRVAPLDVNLDGALIEAMLEMGARAMDRFEVS